MKDYTAEQIEIMVNKVREIAHDEFKDFGGVEITYDGKTLSLEFPFGGCAWHSPQNKACDFLYNISKIQEFDKGHGEDDGDNYAFKRPMDKVVKHLAAYLIEHSRSIIIASKSVISEQEKFLESIDEFKRKPAALAVLSKKDEPVVDRAFAAHGF